MKMPHLPLLLLIAGSVATPALGQEAPYWGDLRAGPHEVGFRSTWILDPGRSYSIQFEDETSYGGAKSPRPILVNIWYPATTSAGAPRMVQGDYLEIAAEDPYLAPFSRALAEYNRGIIAEEVTGQPPDGPDAAARLLLERVLATPTAAVRDAEGATGTFPIVIYHSGHGSSFEDNAVLCEYLASHGYIVLGSAFQAGDGDGLGTDTRAASIADVDALIRFARAIPGADWSRIGLVGHSGGAHLGLRYAVRPGSAVDAFVLMDTTQDYRSLFLDLWDFPRALLEDRAYVTAPLLYAANPHAFFQVADSLSSAERYYLTIPELGHNEFIAQGLIGEHTPAARRGYEALVAGVGKFLDGYLKSDAAALRALRQEYGGTVFGGPDPHLEYAPEGQVGPPAYRMSGEEVPTPRQLRPLLDELGSEATVELLGRLRQRGAVTPILDEPQFQVALLYELIQRGKLEDGQVLYRFFRETQPDLILQILRWYDLFIAIDDAPIAELWLQVARALDPSHPEVIKRR